MLAAGKDATEQDCGVDGGHLRVPHPFARLRVREMVEKAPVVRQFPPQEAQSRKDALQRFSSCDKAAMFADTERSEAKPSGGNARRHGLAAGGVDVAAVQYHPCFGISLLPEKLKAGLLQLVQKLIIFFRQNRRPWWAARGSCGLCQQFWQHSRKRQAEAATQHLAQHPPT